MQTHKHSTATTQQTQQTQQHTAKHTAQAQTISGVARVDLLALIVAAHRIARVARAHDRVCDHRARRVPVAAAVVVPTLVHLLTAVHHVWVARVAYEHAME